MSTWPPTIAAASADASRDGESIILRLMHDEGAILSIPLGREVARQLAQEIGVAYAADAAEPRRGSEAARPKG